MTTVRKTRAHVPTHNTSESTSALPNCQYRGFTGTQGVIIPKSNAINLVLDSTVIEAVKKGLFHIYTVETVDDALTILMEQEAGKISSKGRYPKNSINYHAVNRLYNLALIVSGGDGE